MKFLIYVKRLLGKQSRKLFKVFLLKKNYGYFFKSKNINIQIDKSAKVFISESVVFREYCNILVSNEANLIISNGVFFNNYCSINCLNKIVIGDNSIFGEGVKIYDHNHKYEINPIKIEKGDFTSASISIGKNCWIGSNVTILKGVTIGDNVIIGANCLIYKSISDNSIVKHIESLDIQEACSV